MKYELIRAPSRGTQDMIRRRARGAEALGSLNWGAVLLVQGMVIEVLAAADIGAKAADVAVTELLGNCPQHINSVAFIGTPSQIDQVLNALRNGGKIS